MPSPAAEELYASLGPAFTNLDTNGQLLAFCEALVSGSTDQVHELVTDSAAGPGWQSSLFNPDLCPAAFLPWLAQMTGSILYPEMTVEAQREAIKNPQPFRRGTPEALIGMVKSFLTGTKLVLVDERYESHAWRLRVRTLKSETPEPEVLKAAIKARQKPVGIVLTYEAAETWLWSEVWGKYETWTKAKEANATWTILRTRPPGF